MNKNAVYHIYASKLFSVNLVPVYSVSVSVPVNFVSVFGVRFFMPTPC
jgi:hypothetical protein